MRARYDETLAPPGPVLAVRVSAPGNPGPGVALRALLDTGADCSLLPVGAARALGLPAIDEIWIEGVSGDARRATVYAARLELAGYRALARVTAFGGEAILGRDVLNRVVLRLDGPRLTFSVTAPPARRLRA